MGPVLGVSMQTGHSNHSSSSAFLFSRTLLSSPSSGVFSASPSPSTNRYWSIISSSQLSAII